MRPHRTLFALYLLFLGEVFRIEGAGRIQDSEDHDADIGENADTLAKLPLPEQDIQAILGGTAKRLLGI